MLRDGGRVSGSSLGSLPGERVLEDSGRACGTETSYFKFSINVDLNQLLYLYKTKAKFLLSHVDIQFFFDTISISCILAVLVKSSQLCICGCIANLSVLLVCVSPLARAPCYFHPIALEYN